MLETWFETSSPLLMQVLEDFSAYVPQLVAALVVLVVGAAMARAFRRLLVKILQAFSVSKWIENTPVEHFLQNADITEKIEDITGSIAYWLVMLLVLQTAAAELGLTPVSELLSMVLGYVPHIISSILVLFFGVLVAGVIESLVKGAIKTIDGQSARFLGKIASYLVMAIAILIAISELGIASEFIMILFIGLIATISLGFGLALGFGGKDIVAKMLDRWYEATVKDIRE